MNTIEMTAVVVVASLVSFFLCCFAVTADTHIAQWLADRKVRRGQ